MLMNTTALSIRCVFILGELGGVRGRKRDEREAKEEKGCFVYNRVASRSRSLSSGLSTISEAANTYNSQVYSLLHCLKQMAGVVKII